MRDIVCMRCAQRLEIVVERLENCFGFRFSGKSILRAAINPHEVGHLVLGNLILGKSRHICIIMLCLCLGTLLQYAGQH